VEVLWAQRHEGALSVADVIDGRLRLDLLPAWREAARAAVAEIMSDLAPTGGR
jgi:glycerol-3-phosphate dehydrogenase